MKKLVLLFTGMLMGLTTVTAAESKSATQSTDLDLTSRYRYAQPILFVERGVEFLIFADGSFDFNTNLITTAPQNGNYYYRRSNKRRSINGTYGAPGTQRHFGSRGVLVTHDRLGRVRRIGNVFINYDRQGRIKRAGTVYMRYKRGLLKQVGGLHIQYNRRGHVIGTHGFVNFSNQGCGFCGITGCDVDHYETGHDDWNDDDDFDDDDYYYYRRGKKIKKHKKYNRNKDD